MTLVLKKFIISFLIAIVVLGLLSALVYDVVISAAKNPVVRTKLGSIEGLKADDGDYFMFMGVPYALVDRKNPFGQSIPHPRFEEVFKAHSDTAICPQFEEYNRTVTGSLDCLHLNIYVPNSYDEGQAPFPVLVYIHGGRYEVGYAGRYLYGPKYFMSHDVILVTVNYRVGPYGFLCLGTQNVPGNQGLRDQVTAFKWVKENIASFGGDPFKVTVAGGENVALHLMYGQKKFFNQVIVESGLHPIIMYETNMTIPLQLADNLGFRTDDVEKALEFLASQETNSVIKSSNDLHIKYSPCVEKNLKNVDRLINNYTKYISEIPNVNNLSLLIGQTNKERLAAYANKKPAEYENIFKDQLIEFFDFDKERLQRMEDLIRHFYIGDEDINEDVKQKIIDFSSDLVYNYPTRNNIDKLIKNGAKKIYYNVFSYSGARNFAKRFHNIDPSFSGSSHVDQIGYLFDISYMKNGITPEDQLIIDRITTLWANFVKYGDPTPETSQLLPVKWEPVTNQSLVYYNISSVLSTGTRPFHDRMAFWDLFYKLNGKYERLMPIIK